MNKLLPIPIKHAAMPLVLSAALLPAVVRADDAAEIADLRQSAAQMQEMMKQMQARIAELERKQSQTASMAATAAAASSSIKPKTVTRMEPNVIPPSNLAEAMRAPRLSGKRSPVTYRKTMNDRQAPVARPLDFTVDPDYRGFFAIPNTPAIIKLNAKARIDATYDNKNAGSKARFIPAKFPLAGDPSAGGGGQFNLNANGTTLMADVRAPDQPGNFRFYYQNDFFGSEERMAYRINHIYGHYFGLKIGYTTSAWENADIWPDTVDFEGPNSVIYARRAVAHYTHSYNENWNSTFGIEQPDFYVDLPSSDGSLKQTRMPDFTFNTRWENAKWGHVQASTILRDIGARRDGGEDQHVFGWGLNLGFNLNLSENDTFQFLGVYGEGVGGTGNDTSFLSSDAGYNANGSLEALPYWSLMGAYTHRWNEKYRSSLVFGHADLSPSNGMDADFFSYSNYGAVNTIWQIRDRWSLGAELLYGYKEAQSGRDSGDIFRFQVGMVYSLF
ncbi:DcaP family trimeric outer membrane transporter [Rubritalea marina]|uniref:DcaP family trimeric outer membrane transporter n=1 Tax=Rubritalea marina TaxID=361055 RepID=UPI0003787FE1|nr:DcaP family trimeric outer membrane transporter [Rubritalea marina]